MADINTLVIGVKMNLVDRYLLLRINCFCKAIVYPVQLFSFQMDDFLNAW